MLSKSVADVAPGNVKLGKCRENHGFMGRAFLSGCYWDSRPLGLRRRRRSTAICGGRFQPDDQRLCIHSQQGLTSFLDQSCRLWHVALGWFEQDRHIKCGKSLVESAAELLPTPQCLAI